MHSTRFRFTRHDAGFSVVAELLENGDAVLAFRRDFADTYFVTYYFYWLLAFDYSTGK